MTNFKKYEVVIAYCKSYETDTYEVNARTEKEAISKARRKGFSSDCEAVLWEYATEIKEDESKEKTGL